MDFEKYSYELERNVIVSDGNRRQLLGFIYFVKFDAMSTQEGAECHKQKAEITHYMQATKM